MSLCADLTANIVASQEKEKKWPEFDELWRIRALPDSS
jgi:hypothetical protein